MKSDYNERELFEDSLTDNVNSEKPQKEKLKNNRLKKILLKIGLCILGILLFLTILGFVMSLFLPQKTNVLIVATDEDGTRTDTIMVASYDKNTNGIKILSIPRDTYITVSDSDYKIMRSEFPEPGSKSMKINTIYHFAPQKYKLDILKRNVESIINSKINYYIKLDFKSFKYIVDSLGGVDFYVPCDMKYHDPLQNLNIDLKEGMQHLDGNKAEQLVRFRKGYINQDIGRIQVQQQFFKALLNKALSKESILSKPSLYFNLLFKYDYVETDVSFFDVLSYIFEIGDIDINNINSHVLDGISKYINGQSVYVLDDSKNEIILKEIFN